MLIQDGDKFKKKLCQAPESETNSPTIVPLTRLGFCWTLPLRMRLNHMLNQKDLDWNREEKETRGI